MSGKPVQDVLTAAEVATLAALGITVNATTGAVETVAEVAKAGVTIPSNIVKNAFGLFGL